MSIENIQGLPTGYIIQDKYKILDRLGNDAISITYLVSFNGSNNLHTIREYYPKTALRETDSIAVIGNGADSESFEWGLKRFKEEAQLLNEIDHPNIIKVTELIEANGTLYYVMPYLGSKTLKDWMESHHYPSSQAVENIFYPLLKALKYSHSKALLHLNITPSNIIITEDNAPVLINFGAAKQLIGLKYKYLEEVSTEPYAPIETCQGLPQYNESSDLYSLSACMYQAITGKTIADAIERSNGMPILPLSDIKAIKETYPDNLLDVIDKNLAFKASERYQSVEETQHALFGVNISSPVSPDPTPQINEQSSNNKVWLGGIGLVLIGGLILSSVAYFNQSPSKDALSSEQSSETSNNSETIDKGLRIESDQSALSDSELTTDNDIDMSQEDVLPEADIVDQEQSQSKESDSAEDNEALDSENETKPDGDTLADKRKLAEAKKLADEKKRAEIEKAKAQAKEAEAKAVARRETQNNTVSKKDNNTTESNKTATNEGVANKTNVPNNKSSNDSSSTRQNSASNVKQSTNASRNKGPWVPELREGKWGFVNLDGEPLTPFMFNQVMAFSEGMAGVRKGNSWGFVNTTGNIAIPLKFSESSVDRTSRGSYRGVQPFVFKRGKAWVSNTSTGTPICINKSGSFTSCED